MLIVKTVTHEKGSSPPSNVLIYLFFKNTFSENTNTYLTSTYQFYIVCKTKTITQFKEMSLDAYNAHVAFASTFDLLTVNGKRQFSLTYYVLFNSGLISFEPMHYYGYEAKQQ